ncbi:hypothetical protein E2320_021847, partial [Naja naja]
EAETSVILGFGRQLSALPGFPSFPGLQLRSQRQELAGARRGKPEEERERFVGKRVLRITTSSRTPLRSRAVICLSSPAHLQVLDYARHVLPLLHHLVESWLQVTGTTGLYLGPGRSCQRTQETFTFMQSS